jgi:hypothetical protein
MQYINLTPRFTLVIVWTVSKAGFVDFEFVKV